MTDMRRYLQIMEQVDHPEGIRSRHIVKCTPTQAVSKVGELYPDNSSWRTVEMMEMRDD